MKLVFCFKIAAVALLITAQTSFADSSKDQCKTRAKEVSKNQYEYLIELGTEEMQRVFKWQKGSLLKMQEALFSQDPNLQKKLLNNKSKVRQTLSAKTRKKAGSSAYVKVSNQAFSYLQDSYDHVSGLIKGANSLNEIRKKNCDLHQRSVYVSTNARLKNPKKFQVSGQRSVECLVQSDLNVIVKAKGLYQYANVQETMNFNYKADNPHSLRLCSSRQFNQRLVADGELQLEHFVACSRVDLTTGVVSQSLYFKGYDTAARIKELDGYLIADAEYTDTNVELSAQEYIRKRTNAYCEPAKGFYLPLEEIKKHSIKI